MGIFGTLLSKLAGRSASEEARSDRETAARVAVSVSGANPEVHVPDEEVVERAREHAFVLHSDLPPLKTAHQWWNDAAQKRRVRDEADKAYAWVAPFVSLDVAESEALKAAMKAGPRGLGTIVKELRALIRDRRKSGEPHLQLLSSLYGACVGLDFARSLSFEGTYVADCVDLRELQQVRIEYPRMGYQCVESLGKTDVKWIIEAFGEPAEHQSFDALWPHIRRNAVIRYCRGQLRSKNEASKSLGWAEQSMEDWLHELVRRNIGYHKEWQERVAARQAFLAEAKVALDAAWDATDRTFVVADLETTGLNPDVDEVLEVAAVKVKPDGTIAGEFTALVRTTGISEEIAQLTGISQQMSDTNGRPLPEVLSAFLNFIGACPVFFHNAPFDVKFLARATRSTGLAFRNPVHDTLLMARQAWPSLGTYRLAALTQHLAVSAPTHRALADALTTKSVLLAAKERIRSSR